MESIKNSYKNNKFKISAPTWNDKFELPYQIFKIILSISSKTWRKGRESHNKNISK